MLNNLFQKLDKMRPIAALFTFLMISFISSFSILFAQEVPYFQQKINYKIQAALDDKTHTLHGSIEMEYHNQSPDALSEIYMHLWPNAYRNNNTAFAKQKIRMNDTDFYFAPEEERGGIDSLSFIVNGAEVNWSYEPQHKDIALLQLNKPLQPGEKIEISSPFKVKIPNSVSRLGHVGESYQMTQWYPKPAVYDRNGWHPMPYLDMGEFYSEFGDFEVTITLPENYIVAATGELQEDSEKHFLEEKYLESKALLEDPEAADLSFPPSSAQMKTISYKAQNVHDFAWFADKRFYVDKGGLRLSNGDSVETWAFFTDQERNLWKDAVKYLNRSVKFYSDKVGNYPYPHATAVQSALSAGAGMEYPMITVIGLSQMASALDNVITHEVGHNWFYGILAFNERDHVWLDEGFNSYYDHRYMEEFYGGAGLSLPSFLLGHSSVSLEEYIMHMRMNDNTAQPPCTHADHYNSEINYWIGGYEKPARGFKQLEKYLGTAAFDRIMHDFYKKWAFKHPQPADVISHFESESQKDLSWLFEGVMCSNKDVDYRISKLDKKNSRIKIRNTGQIPAPMPIDIVSATKDTTTLWVEGFENRNTMDSPLGTDPEEIILDADHSTMDINRQNNQWRSSQFLSTFEPIKLKLLSRFDNPEHSELFLMPLVAWNEYDTWMPGLSLHNMGLVQKPFEFAINPLYSFQTEQLNGLLHLEKHWKVHHWGISKIDLGLNLRQFSESERRSSSLLEIGNRKYTRWNPFLALHFQSKPGSSRKSSLRLEYIDSQVELLFKNDSGEDAYLEAESNPIYRMEYEITGGNSINKHGFWAQADYRSFGYNGQIQNNSLQINLAYQLRHQYRKSKYFGVRGYLGAFLLNDNRNSTVVDATNFINGSNLSLIDHAGADYAYDDYYFGRTASSGLLAQQVDTGRGGFKVPINQTPNSFSKVGMSNDWVAAVNIYSDLPINMPKILPLEVFADLGYYSDTSLRGQFLYSTGISLNYLGGAIRINLPILNSESIEDALDDIGGGYFNRMSFTIDLNKLNPVKMKDKIEM